MQVPVTFDGVYLSHQASPYEYEGRKGVSYSIALECDGSVGNIPISQELYNELERGILEKYKRYDFFGTFNTNYKRLMTEGVLGSKK